MLKSDELRLAIRCLHREILRGRETIHSVRGCILQIVGQGSVFAKRSTRGRQAIRGVAVIENGIRSKARQDLQGRTTLICVSVRLEQPPSETYELCLSSSQRCQYRKAIVVGGDIDLDFGAPKMPGRRAMHQMARVPAPVPLLRVGSGSEEDPLPLRPRLLLAGTADLVRIHAPQTLSASFSAILHATCLSSVNSDPGLSLSAQALHNNGCPLLS